MGAKKLSEEEYKSLLSCHRALMNEHYEFVSQSQHPLASADVKHLAIHPKYRMVPRWWEHSIHSYLETLRHRLPDSLEHMLGYVQNAISMTTLLLESVGARTPVLEEAYLEGLGDLWRYRTAIEEHQGDRLRYANQARYWYDVAQNRAPCNGRLWHHKSTLAGGNDVKQVAHFGQAMTATHRYDASSSLLLGVFAPERGKEIRQRLNRLGELAEGTESPEKMPSMGALFANVHRALHAGQANDVTFESDLRYFYTALANEMVRKGPTYKELGCYVALGNVSAVMDFGNKEGFLQQRVMPVVSGEAQPTPTDQPTPRDVAAQGIAMRTLDAALSRPGNRYVAPQVHVSLAFIRQLFKVPGASVLALQGMPWTKMNSYLNALIQAHPGAQFEQEEFPPRQGRPLFEDFELRGLSWTDAGKPETAERDYLPKDWFAFDGVDDDEYYLEAEETEFQRVERRPEANGTEFQRVERILWLGTQIAKHKEAAITYDHKAKRFTSKDAPRFGF